MLFSSITGDKRDGVTVKIGLVEYGKAQEMVDVEGFISC
jgi:hypothetical protein